MFFIQKCLWCVSQSRHENVSRDLLSLKSKNARNINTGSQFSLVQCGKFWKFSMEGKRVTTLSRFFRLFFNMDNLGKIRQLC